MSQILEEYTIPAAIDLFTRVGAGKPSVLASRVRCGGYGCACLWPRRGCASSGGLAAALTDVPADGVLRPLASGRTTEGKMAEIGLMASHDGRRLFCVKGACDELRTFRNLLCYASVFGVRVAVEPSIGVLCEKGQMNEGRVSGALGLLGLPASAEYLAVEMCLTLAAEFGTPLHLHGLSCRASADKVRAAKAAGQNVTCDVAAVNLILDETVYTIERLRGDLKVWPAVRTADDRAALWAALDDGTVDAVTSGYCARSSDDLALCFEEIPFGSERMETLPADLLNAWEAQGRPTRVKQLLAALSDGPRKILGTDALSENIAGTTVASRDEFGWHVRYENENGGTR